MVCDAGTVGGDAQTPTNISDDTDCDGVENSSDLFQNDATESVDTDSDGIGDNSDTDADGDDYVIMGADVVTDSTLMIAILLYHSTPTVIWFVILELLEEMLKHQRIFPMTQIAMVLKCRRL